ncbi:hypothetical protein [Rhodoferax sp.]|uniref:hypothetical protein n=1 Tax=Rhodoferax sp. TaxID=50421 RepID=UPI002ACE83FB|nr:hypothetical protein [Rhodoferax sp.]MDZ7918742.1 hypothetical protein [Rhodoferax sp.]
MKAKRWVRCQKGTGILQWLLAKGCPAADSENINEKRVWQAQNMRKQLLFL